MANDGNILRLNREINIQRKEFVFICNKISHRNIIYL